MRTIDTNSGTDSTGKPALGLEHEEVMFIAGGMAGGGLYLAISSNVATVTEGHLAFAAVIAVFPIVWVFTMVRNRPPHFQRDFILSILGFGRWNATPRRPKYDPVILGVIGKERQRRGT